MITGDHHVTARAIAGELGIPPSDGAVLTGQEIDALDDLGFDAAVRRATVFARVSPHHKLRIVAALQRQGKVVAMTGDGVNDAPALKKADIGVAMGITGTDVTKEAAVMTLTDDNFASIVAAVEEGRAIFGNIKKYLMYLLSSNVGEILIMTVATLMGWPMPLTAVQLLYLNLATDGFPALALAVDPPVSDLMLRPPRDPRSGVFARRSLILMLAGSVWLAILTLGMFLYAWNSDMDHTEARTFAFVLIVVTELVKAYNFRSDRLSAFIRPFSNRWLNLAILWEIVLLLCVIYIPFFHVPFGTRALHLHDWALIVPAALSMIPVLEVIKWILRLASGRAARVSSNLHKSAAPIIPSCSDKLQRCSISMEESAPPEVSRSE
jgi:Ca2+-transporting ATPase